MSPLLLDVRVRIVEDLEQYIKKVTSSVLPDKNLFIVDVIVSGAKNNRKIKVLIDGDDGIDIDTCASISRSISNVLDQEDKMDGHYTLEVSSPGLNYPLKLKRQYKKNIGRNLEVLLTDGRKIVGELHFVDDEKIQLIESLSKGKKGNKELAEGNTKKNEFPFSAIKNSIIQVSFKK